MNSSGEKRPDLRCWSVAVFPPFVGLGVNYHLRTIPPTVVDLPRCPFLVIVARIV
jgi:hypothetical protein